MFLSVGRSGDGPVSDEVSDHLEGVGQNEVDKPRVGRLGDESDRPASLHTTGLTSALLGKTQTCHERPSGVVGYLSGKE